MNNLLSSQLSSIVGNGTGSGSASDNPYSHDAVNNRNTAYGVGGQNPFVDYAHQQQSYLWGPGNQATQYGAGLEGRREGLYDNLMNSLSLGGIKTAAQTQRNSITSNADQGAKQAAMTLKGLGYGDGASGGAAAGIIGSGVNQANASDAHFNDPGYIASILGQGTNVIGQAQQNPYTQEAAGYEPYIMGQNQTNYAQQGQGLWGQVAGLAGAYLGGPGGASLFGGGQKSAPNPYGAASPGSPGFQGPIFSPS